jgi:hypothetical protein
MVFQDFWIEKSAIFISFPESQGQLRKSCETCLMWNIKSHSKLHMFRASNEDFIPFYSVFLILIVHLRREFKSCCILFKVAHILPEISWLFMKNIFNKTEHNLKK